jgi:hypothetical protein
VSPRMRESSYPSLVQYLDARRARWSDEMPDQVRLSLNLLGRRMPLACIS